MPDFMATYGLSDAEVRSGLRGLEQAASQHTRRIESITSQSSHSLANVTSRGLAKGFLAAVGLGSVAAVAAMGLRTAINATMHSTKEYASVNEDVAKSLREIQYKGEAAYQSLGRNTSELVLQLKQLTSEAVGGAAEILENLKVQFLAFKTGLDPSYFRKGTEQTIAKENAYLSKRAEAIRLEMDANRLSVDPGNAQRLGAAELRAEAREKEQLLKNEGLLWHLRNRGLDSEADKLERSIHLESQSIIQLEKRRQLDEEISGRNKTRSELENLKEKYATARESTADTIEANAARIFGLEASQRQVQIAEVQLRYDQQLRDIARDKALLEEDRVRASALLNEQREAELGILMAQRGERRNARSIALGSSVDARQAFAPIVNEERNDRKKAQEKFDRMVAELRKIRDNTATRQVATYQ